MKVIVKTNNIDIHKAERHAISEKVKLVFERIAQHIQQVVVSVFDVNGPRGGDDIVCRIKITAPGVPTVVVKTQNSALLQAINTALQRSSLNLVKKLKRKQNFSRNPIHLGAVMSSNPTA